jgi:hypothetical protein
MQLRKTLRATAILAALALPVLGCNDDDTTGPGDETTALTVQLTDAAGDFHAAVVTISEIYLVGTGDNAHVALVSSPVTVDLTGLANSAQLLVDDASVPNGTYSEMRVVISGAYVEVENDDGTTSIYASSPDYAGLPSGATVAGALALPTDAASGIAITLPSDALTYSGDDESLLLDFEASRSFTNDGTAGWSLAPVVQGAVFTEPAKARALLTLGEGVTLPDIGEATPTLADFRAVLTTADGATETQALTDADLNGAFEADFNYVLPGEYTVTFEGPAGLTVTTDPALPIAVTTAAGTTVDASATITGASVTPP